ncbi:LysR substrate-binding domain-containing protein [Burkholderia sp. Ax-1724]|uniref:LysR substrate-binding domain-containing protein n=1 Tax=Burkholderia sp. Ax-1724 TaxID=2608336 RepID=UPI00141F2EB8|nr:LysR substrate-binding domain-containing protein [Burkholderia sp. Ax-1724]NIF56077.1 LysR family transcriptional regulator [Burkholderia sp. Ax-1724]
MELRHLRYFIAAAEEEHFGRAAVRLHITRPAVSQIIADLEGELGTPLFERLAHTVKLTAAGRTLLPQLVRMMDDLNEAIAITKRVGHGMTGTLRIGYGSLTLMHSLFKAAVKLFRATYPEINLSLVEVSTSQQPKALAEGKIDAGFMHLGPNPHPGKRRTEINMEREGIVLDSICIQTGSIGVAVPNDHRFARRKSLTLEDLADEPLVVDPKSSSSLSYGQLYAFCQAAGFEPNIVQEVSTIASQLNLISVGMGIGLAVMGKNFHYPSDVTVIPLMNLNYSTRFIFGWVHRQNDPVLDKMIEIVKNLSK